MEIAALNVIKVFAPTTVAFFIGIAITPIVAHYLYKHKMWKKKSVAVATDGRNASISQSLHRDEEKRVPRMGGVVVWGSVFITVFIFWIISFFLSGNVAGKFDFLSRNQTWLPLFAMAVGAIIGLVDDYFSVVGKFDHLAGGLSSGKRLLVVAFIGIVGGWWFFFKLGVSHFYIPFWGYLDIGIFFIPFFILVLLGIYAGGVIDGIDGLAGGVLASAFSAYGVIAFMQQQIDIAALSFSIVGALLAFLWFNIPPARFYLSETGTMALTMALGIIAFLTKQVAVLPVIAFPLILAAGSSALQLLSKKVRNGKKIFLVAPIHHHFEAIGWPSYKVVMRFWVISIIFAFIGVILTLVG